MPLVSVIIPVYNVEKYLKECLDSVINQTLKNIEIICVNDGSTDSSPKILEEYAARDNRIKIINKENGGLSSARNAGINVACGEFIGFVDSDDWVETDYFEKLYCAVKENDADIAYTNIVKVFKDGANEHFFGPKTSEIVKTTEEKYKISNVPYNCHCVNKIYHTKKLRSLKILFEEGVYFEDMEWTHKVLYYLGKLVTVPDTNYYYRIQEDSITKIKCEKNINDLAAARYKSMDFIQRNGIKINNFKPYFATKKERYSLFGITVLKMCEYVNYRYYYLFGLLPVFEIKRRIYFEDSKCQRFP